MTQIFQLNYGTIIPIYENIKLNVLAGVQFQADLVRRGDVLGYDPDRFFQELQSGSKQMYRTAFLQGKTTGILRSKEACLENFELVKAQNQVSYNTRIQSLNPGQNYYFLHRVRADATFDAINATCTNLATTVETELTPEYLGDDQDGELHVDPTEFFDFSASGQNEDASLFSITASPVVSVALEKEICVFSQPVVVSLGASRSLKTQENEIFVKVGLPFDKFLSTPIGSLRGSFVKNHSNKNKLSLDVVHEVDFQKGSSTSFKELSTVGIAETSFSGKTRSEPSRVSPVLQQADEVQVYTCVPPPVIPPDNLYTRPSFVSGLTIVGLLSFCFFLKMKNLLFGSKIG
jgi:hypothetical protein